MTDRCFLDTNVLVYSIDESDSLKRRAANDLVVELSKSGNGIISTQVLQEFYNIITKKIGCPAEKARELVKKLSECFEVHTNSAHDIIRAIDISMRTQFSFWDSLILSASIASECSVLYSEDLNDGQFVENVRIVNPF